MVLTAMEDVLEEPFVWSRDDADSAVRLRCVVGE